MFASIIQNATTKKSNDNQSKDNASDDNFNNDTNTPVHNDTIHKDTVDKDTIHTDTVDKDTIHNDTVDNDFSKYDKIIFHDARTMALCSIWTLFQNLKSNPEIECKIYLVSTNGIFTGGSDTENTMSVEYNRIFHNQFPEFNYKNIANVGGSLINILNVSQLSKITGKRLHMLQLAPLTGVNPKFFKENTILKRVIDADKKSSINTNKSWISLPRDPNYKSVNDTNEQYLEQEKLLSSVPTIFVGPKLSNFELSDSFTNNLPLELKDTIYRNGFKQFVNRISPYNDDCEQILQIEYDKLITFSDAFALKHDEIPDEIEKKINRDSDKYIKEMVICDNEVLVKKQLTTMYKIVYLTTGNTYNYNTRIVKYNHPFVQYFDIFNNGIDNLLLSVDPCVFLLLLIIAIYYGCLLRIISYITGILSFIIIVNYYISVNVSMYHYCDFSYSSFENINKSKENYIKNINKSNLSIQKVNSLATMIEFMNNRTITDNDFIVPIEELESYKKQINDLNV